MRKDFYVYEHRTKDTDEVFYIGKGSGKRAYWFYDRNEYHTRITLKHGCKVSILHENLSEEEAFELEYLLITEYKKEGLCKANLCNGGKGGFRGGIASLEKREKMRASMLGKNVGNKNGMYQKTGKQNPASKTVIAIKDTDQIFFESANIAEKTLKVPHVRDYAKGLQNHHHRKSGWSFYYEKEFKGGI